VLLTGGVTKRAAHATDSYVEIPSPHLCDACASRPLVMDSLRPRGFYDLVRTVMPCPATR
jgi:hypothetical protein